MATEVPFSSPYGIEVSNLTEPVPILYGGTGKATQQDAINALVGAQTANRVLRSNGTNMSLAQVALSTDVTGTLAIANGGTGSTTASGARSALSAAVRGANNDITSMTALTNISPARTSLEGADILIRASDGDTSYSGYPGGDVTIQSGTDGNGVNGTGQNIILQIGAASPSTGSNFIVRHNSDTERFRINKNGAYRITSTTTIPLNEWMHFALVRSSAVTKLYINGVQEGSSYADTNNYSGVAPVIGGRFAIASGDYRSWYGYIQDLRVTIGVARYTDNFTVPSNSSPDY